METKHTSSVSNLKLILLLSIAAFSLPAHAQMQPPPPTKAEALAASGAVPSKGVNVVIIQTADSAKVALKHIATQLQQAGFVIDRLDYELLSLSTKSKSFAGSGFHTMTASAAAEKGSIVLRGEWHGQMGAYSTNEQAAFTNAASRKAFAELQAVAAAYPGAQVRYEKRP